jgi:hypothetical protein
MGYAFEGVPYYELPDSEQLSIWQMNARIRDHSLTDAEWWAKHIATQEMKQS